MAMMKRALIYTLSVILFLSVVIIVVMLRHRETIAGDTDVFLVRVDTMEQFIKDFERDLDRVTYISGYRTFLSMEDYVSGTGEYLDNASAVFLEIFFTGSYNGTEFDVMKNSSFSDYMTRIEYNAHRVHIDLTANVTDAYLYQVDPWHVVAGVVMQLHFADETDLLGWNFTKNYETKIPIYDIKDPLYAVATGGKISNPIERENETLFITASNDTTILQLHVNNSYYIESSDAPSILMRFEGNFSDSPYGIESLVNLPLLTAQGISLRSGSTVVDYLYFNSSLTLGDTIVNMDSWFRLDDEHLALYNATGKTT